MPLGSLLSNEFEVGMAKVGILVGAYSISGGIVSIVSSFFIDRFDRKKVMLLAFGFFTVGTLLCGLSHNFTTMLFSRGLTGMFSGVLSAMVFTIVADEFPYEERATAMGKVMTGISLAAVLGIPFGNYSAMHFGWQCPFLLLALLGVLAFLMIALLLPDMNKHLVRRSRRLAVENFKELIGSRSRRTGLLLIFLLMMGSFPIIAFIPDYMVHNVGIGQDQVSYIYFAGGLGSMIMMQLVGRMCDKIGNQAVYSILSILALAAIYLVTNLPPSGLALVIAATSSLFMFGGSRNVPANTIVISTCEPSHRAGFMSLVAAVQQFSGGLAIWMGSLFLSTASNGFLTGFDKSGFFAIIMSVVAVPVMLKVKRIPEVIAPQLEISEKY
jgi:DHA1 family inner membrane transport protein